MLRSNAVQFYTQFQDKMRALETYCRDFVMARRVEAEEMQT